MVEGFIQEIIGRCEACEKLVAEGDLHHQTADGCVLCEDHSPMLSDVIRQHEEILAEPEWSNHDLGYDTRDEMEQFLTVMRAEIERDGDRRITHT
jgi:hypothetical protein